MAKAAAPVPSVREYFVYTDAPSVGEAKVIETERGKVVRMSSAQAQYWVDQGAIGPRAYVELSEGAKAALAQFRKTPLEKEPE